MKNKGEGEREKRLLLVLNGSHRSLSLSHPNSIPLRSARHLGLPTARLRRPAAISMAKMKAYTIQE